MIVSRSLWSTMPRISASELDSAALVGCVPDPWSKSSSNRDRVGVPRRGTIQGWAARRSRVIRRFDASG
jgi:hypothetical protein